MTFIKSPPSRLALHTVILSVTDTIPLTPFWLWPNVSGDFVRGSTSVKGETKDLWKRERDEKRKREWKSGWKNGKGVRPSEWGQPTRFWSRLKLIKKNWWLEEDQVEENYPHQHSCCCFHRWYWSRLGIHSLASAHGTSVGPLLFHSPQNLWCVKKKMYDGCPNVVGGGEERGNLCILHWHDHRQRRGASWAIS